MNKYQVAYEIGIAIGFTIGSAGLLWIFNYCMGRGKTGLAAVVLVIYFLYVVRTLRNSFHSNSKKGGSE